MLHFLKIPSSTQHCQDKSKQKSVKHVTYTEDFCAMCNKKENLCSYGLGSKVARLLIFVHLNQLVRNLPGIHL